MPMQKIIPAVLLLAFSTQAFAFQTLVTSETGTNGTDVNSADMTFVSGRERTDGSTDRAYEFPFTYTRGITDSLDVYVGGAYARFRPNEGDRASGFGSPSLGVAWRFYENEASGTSVAIKPELLFPVSSGREQKGLGVGRLSGGIKLIVTQEMPFGSISMNLAAGRERAREEAGENTTVTGFSLMPKWQISEQWKMGLEVGAAHAKSHEWSSTERFIGAAATYSLNKTLDIEVGTSAARDNADPHTTSQSFSAGIALNF